MADGTVEIEKRFVIAGIAGAGAAEYRHQNPDMVDKLPKDIEKAKKNTDNSSIKELMQKQEKDFESMVGQVGEVSVEVTSITTDLEALFDAAVDVAEQAEDLAQAIRVKSIKPEGEAPELK